MEYLEERILQLADTVITEGDRCVKIESRNQPDIVVSMVIHIAAKKAETIATNAINNYLKANMNKACSSKVMAKEIIDAILAGQ